MALLHMLLQMVAQNLCTPSPYVVATVIETWTALETLSAINEIAMRMFRGVLEGGKTLAQLTTVRILPVADQLPGLRWRLK